MDCSQLEDRILMSATPLGGELAVNSEVLDVQDAPDVATDADGDSVAVWASRGQDGDGWGVYAQRLDADGNAQGSEFRVNSTTAGDQLDPQVAMDDDGNFVIVFSGSGPGDGEGIFAQRFNAAGVAQGGEFRVNSTTGGTQTAASLAMDADGDFVIVWQGPGAGDTDGVYGQRFDASGTALGAEFRANTTTAGIQANARVAADDDGDFVIVWDGNGPGDDSGIFAQRYDAAGVAQGGEFRANTYVSSTQQSAAAAMDADGDFVIVWHGNGPGDSQGIFAQRYDSQGNAQGGNFLLNTTTNNAQQDADVAMRPDGDFVVTWSSHVQDGDGWGVYARAYDASGTAAGGEFAVNTTTTGDQQSPAVAVDHNGNMVILWSGTGPGDADGVFGRRFAPGSPPQLDLDADDSSGQGGSDFAAAFTEDGGPVPIADADATLSDPDSGSLRSLTVTIANRQDGSAELLAADTTGTGISAGYDGGTGVLTLSGPDTVANYQRVLRTITYENGSQDPDTTARAITFVANDGSGTGNTATCTVSLSKTNDAPVAGDDAYDTSQGTTLSVGGSGLLANDGDAEGDLLTAVLVAGPSHGTLRLDPDGTFAYTPDPGFVGSDGFQYTASDGSASSNVATAAITVTGLPTPPPPPPPGDPPPSLPVAPPPPSPGDPAPEDPSDPSPGEGSPPGSDPTDDDPTDDDPDDDETVEDPLLPAGIDFVDRSDNDSALQPDQADRPEEETMGDPLPVASRTAGWFAEVIPEDEESSSGAARQGGPQGNGGSSEEASQESSEDSDSAASSGPRAGAESDAELGERALLASLDSLSQELAEQTGRLTVGSATALGLSAAFSVGYVMWSIRSGHLLAGVLASTPAWNAIDPLPIVSFADAGATAGRSGQREPLGDAEDSLESLFRAESSIVV